MPMFERRVAPVLQIHRNHQWIPAATLQPLRDDCVRVDYLPEYIFSADPAPVPVAFDLPVAFAPPDTGVRDPEMPAFLLDLVPPGRGRTALLRILGLPADARETWPLLVAGAFGSVGNLRIDEAVAFYEGHVGRAPTPPGALYGLTLDHLAAGGNDTLEQMPLHAMLATGTPGIAGDRPKYLFTEDLYGRMHADLSLHDEGACAHWIAKAPRTGADSDRRVLRNEAAYLRVADACGLRTVDVDRVHFVGELLLVPRADRIAGPRDDDDRGSVQRLAQENVAGLAGVRKHASDPLGETIELLRREVLDRAMRNTGKVQGRHALRRLPDGRVQLAPLSDFAPTFLELEPAPPALPLPAWEHTLPAMARTLALAPAEITAVADALAGFAPVVEALPDTMRAHGVEPDIIEACRDAIAEQARQLARLH